ncbi:MAG: hypothetical protein U1E65_26350 [Myxococcota bacterium]
MRLWLPGLMALLLPLGCGDAETSGLDGSAHDAGVILDAAPEMDAGSTPDLGTIDSGFDGGVLDIGVADFGTSDAGEGPDTGEFHTAAHPAYPRMMDQGMGVLSPARIVTIVATNDPMAGDLEAFDRTLAGSQWFATVTRDYGIAATATVAHVRGAAITHNLSSTEVEAYVTDTITANPSVAPDGKSVYMFYLPNNVTIIDEDYMPPEPNTDCSLYAGYHTMLGNGPDNWAVAQHCSFAASQREQLDDLTLTGSHEIIESLTDPVDGFYFPVADDMRPWTSDIWGGFVDGYEETADLCEGSQIMEGMYLYQRVWSIAAAEASGDPCVPALSEPYYNTSAPQGWYPITAGQTIQIPITGWSTLPLEDWGIDAFDEGIGPLSCDLMLSSNMINNGRVVMLSVTAPANARAGDWGSFEVDSSRMGAGTDTYHLWPIGVYVR